MSVPRSALALGISAALGGCFADQGAGPRGSGDGSSTTDITTSDSSPDPTTSSGTSTTSTTTTSSTTGTGCECEPGDTQPMGELCEPCGRLQAACQEDCTWGPPTCAQDLASCVYWHTEAAADGTWVRVALLDPPPQHAPTGPVLAAFDLPQLSGIFALTETRYHLLHAPSGSWDASGPLEDLAPGLPGPVLQAFFFPGGESMLFGVTVGELAHLYELVLDPIQGTLAGTGPCCETWTGEAVPKDITDIRDLFSDPTNAGAWAGGSTPCDGAQVEITAYNAWVGATAVHVQDAQHCQTMAYAAPIAEFGPFVRPGAPPGALIGGTALLDGRLYVFAGG